MQNLVRRGYPVGVTTQEIQSFIQRLMRRELKKGELSTLTTRDLDDINAHLAAYASADLAVHGSYRPLSATFRPSSAAQRLKRTFSEAEILAEFGVFE